MFVKERRALIRIKSHEGQPIREKKEVEHWFVREGLKKSTVKLSKISALWVTINYLQIS